MSLQPSDIPLLAVMQGAEYRSREFVFQARVIFITE